MNIKEQHNNMKSNTKIVGIVIISIFLLNTSVFAALADGPMPYKDESISPKDIYDNNHDQDVTENWVVNLTDKELSMLCGIIIPNDTYFQPLTSISSDTYSSGALDWRNKDGYDWVTPVKNQYSCGSCWAFGAVGVFETMMNIERNDPWFDRDLSEQYLVSDCCDAGSCKGGWHHSALEFIQDETIPIEDCFPYIASDCSCTPCTEWEDNAWSHENIIYIDVTDTSLKSGLETYGPLSIGILINKEWGGYDNGIFEPKEAYTGAHAVVLVGYNDTGGYWIVKNSWGAGWGEQGYIRIKYGYLDVCGPQYVYTVSGIIPPNILPDKYEPDDSNIEARTIIAIDDSQDRDLTAELHDLHYIGDYDWVKFEGIPGTVYTIDTTIIGDSIDTEIAVCYFENNEWNYIYDDDSGDGYGSRIIYDCNNSNYIYVRVKDFYNNVYGAGTDYTLSVTYHHEHDTVNVVSINNFKVECDTIRDTPIRLLGSTGVSGGTVTFTFDPSIVTVTGAVAGDFDSVFVPDYSNVNGGTLRISCTKSGQDLTGDLTIATITLEAVGTSGSCELELSAELTEQNGATVPSNMDNGVFTIINRIAGDVTDDGRVNIGDAVLLFNWVSFVNERGKTYVLSNTDNADVTGDDIINIGDAVLLFNWVSFPNERGTTYILK